MKMLALLPRFLMYLYLGYLALSLLLVMPALNFLAPHYVREFTGRELHKDILLFDPFRLAVSLRGAAIPERDGSDFFRLQRGAVNLSLESLWQPGLVFDEVAVEGLYLHVARQPDGSFNFSDMLPPAAEEEPAPQDTDASIPGVTIKSLHLHADQLALSDFGADRDQPFRTSWDGLDVRAQGLSTIAEDGRPHSLVINDEHGGQLRFEGDVSLPGAYSEGQLDLDGFDLRVPWRFAEPWLNFQLLGGKAHMAGRYRVDWSAAAPAVAITDGEFRLADMELRPVDGDTLPDTHLKLGAFTVSGVALDVPSNQVQIEQVKVAGLDVAGWSEGSRVSLAEMLQPDLPAAAEGRDSEAQPAPESGPAWQLQLAGVSLGDSRIAWRSEYTNPPRLQVTPLDLRIGALSWPAAGETPINLALTVNDEARLQLDGALDLGSGDGRVDYQLQALPVPWFEPNIPEVFHTQITSGTLSLDGDLTLAAFGPALLHQNGEITDFSGAIRGEEESLTGWDSVRWTDLAVDLQQRAVVLQELAIRGYSGRLHIYEDGTVNTQRLLQEEIAAAEAKIEARAQAEAEATGAAPQDAPPGPPWSLSLPLITIDDSAVDFMDESMPIVFRTVIGELQGDISGLSSATGSEARVNLQGSVDGYAPVALEGTARPFDDPVALDLGLSFEGLDLVRLTPYSGTYVGRAISRGTLNLDVRYGLEQSRLKGANSLRIDQLQLGGKVDSDRAVDLPLDLAIALLTDVNGVIQLDVPVSGDVNDPSFSLASVIGGAFVNLITKAATAPFKLLASLVGSDEDLQRVTFAAGSTALDEVGQDKLLDLAGAMAQRPGIRLVLAGRLHPRTDPQFLQRQALDAELLAGGLSPQSLEARDADWEQAVAERYAALGITPEQAVESSREQYRALAARQPVEQQALAKLAEERAVSVKRFLVNDGGIAADRATVRLPEAEAAENSFSGVELSVEN